MAPNRVVLNVEAGGYRSIEAEGSTWRAQSARQVLPSASMERYPPASTFKTTRFGAIS